MSWLNDLIDTMGRNLIDANIEAKKRKGGKNLEKILLMWRLEF